MDIVEHERKVSEQFKKFRAELPKLLKEHAGQWVVYLDRVEGFYPDEDAAHREALKRFGLDASFVLAQIKPIEPVLLTAALGFRPAT